MNFSEYPITILLIAANVIISLIGFNNAAFADKAIMHPYLVKRENQYYRFISSGFLHADFLHLIFNMFTLFFFGMAVEFYFTKYIPVSYTHLRAHETPEHLVCRLLLEKKKAK